MAKTVKLVVFDLAGTTVDDNIDGLPLVTVAMQEAFKMSDFDLQPEQVNKVRGMEKKEAISTLLEELNEKSCSNLVDTIFKNFKISLNKNLNNIRHEIPGTTDVFLELKNRGIKIGLGSGFPHKIVMVITKNLNWNDLVDFISSAETEGFGRPNPCLILSAMKKFDVTDPKEVVKVGDTKLDIQEGKNAGCWTAAVLTGTQGKDILLDEAPDFIVDSVKDLPVVIEKIQGC